MSPTPQCTRTHTGYGNLSCDFRIWLYSVIIRTGAKQLVHTPHFWVENGRRSDFVCTQKPCEIILLVGVNLKLHYTVAQRWHTTNMYVQRLLHGREIRCRKSLDRAQLCHMNDTFAGNYVNLSMDIMGRSKPSARGNTITRYRHP